MADDREILRELWDGRIPTSFSLASNEVETLSAPDPYYLMLPRQTYLPIATEKVRKHFSKHVKVEHQENPMWFEFDGTPLQWHRPLGVLYDLAVMNSDGEARPPWSLVVHFDNYPHQEILRLDSPQAVEMNFMSSIKEADFIKHAGKIISTMQKKDHLQLWQGLQNDKFDQFWAVNRRLMERMSGEEGFKAIPVRIYRGDQMILQKLYKTIGPERKKRTLQDLLDEAFPDEDNSDARKLDEKTLEV
eukprot:TCALIF_02016-PA protein Name:"Similar to ATG5 Autophagy protein 5 (Pongo abelii)" AED:0.09 eAED:0.09 QI:4/1/1/1/1/1/4/341/245